MADDKPRRRRSVRGPRQVLRSHPRCRLGRAGGINAARRPGGARGRARDAANPSGRRIRRAGRTLGRSRRGVVRGPSLGDRRHLGDGADEEDDVRTSTQRPGAERPGDLFEAPGTAESADEDVETIGRHRLLGARGRRGGRDADRGGGRRVHHARARTRSTTNPPRRTSRRPPSTSPARSGADRYDTEPDRLRRRRRPADRRTTSWRTRRRRGRGGHPVRPRGATTEPADRRRRDRGHQRAELAGADHGRGRRRPRPARSGRRRARRPGCVPDRHRPRRVLRSRSLLIGAGARSRSWRPSSCWSRRASCSASLVRHRHQPATAVGLVTGALIMIGAYYQGEGGHPRDVRARPARHVPLVS